MTWKLLVFVFRVLVPPPRAPRALDCHFQLSCSHSRFIFSESNSSGGMEEPKEKMEVKQQPGFPHFSWQPAEGSIASSGLFVPLQALASVLLRSVCLGLSHSHTASGEPWRT